MNSLDVAARSVVCSWTFRHDDQSPQSYRERMSARRIYKASAQFDIISLLVMTLAYALMFGFFRVFGFDAAVTSYCMAFFAFIGIVQMCVSEERARIAGVLSGIVFQIGFFVFINLLHGYRIDFLEILVVSVIHGCAVGYFGAVLVASVFLVSAKLKNVINRTASSNLPDEIK